MKSFDMNMRNVIWAVVQVSITIFHEYFIKPGARWPQANVWLVS